MPDDTGEYMLGDVAVNVVLMESDPTMAPYDNNATSDPLHPGHGLAVEDQDRLAPQLLAVLQANPGLSWVSYGDEAGTFTGAYRTPDGGVRIYRTRIVGE